MAYMRRLFSFLTAILIFCAIITGYYFKVDLELKKTKNTAADYWLNSEKYKCSDFVSENTDDKTITILGSSELGTTFIQTHPLNLFGNKGYNYNTMLIGGGHYQSLWHAINLGALANSKTFKKVVLIVSPQWFSKEGVSPSAFAGTYSYTSYIRLMNNKNITNVTKQNISNRLEKLLPQQKKDIQDVYSTYSNFYNIFSKESILLSWQANKQLNIKKVENTYQKIVRYKDVVTKDIKSIDWNSLMQKAEEYGKTACANNPYGIYNKYFNTYISPKIVSLKGSSKSSSYAVSDEYNDLKLFLDVCKETNVKPMIVIVPVNGLWYDYTEFSKTDRQTYYSNIRKICLEYNTDCADFSDKEYEKYFLCDIMHLGWKGWVYINDEIYKFYSKN